MSVLADLVTRFVTSWEQPDSFPAMVDAYFTDDTVWDNHGVITTKGKAEAVAFFEQFTAATGMAAMKIDLLAIAETGSKVLTERIDYILNAAGETVMTVPVMGIFEIADGKITAWRDYFDTIKGAPPA
ncbi:MAG: limonene-1,2-epoxide hydrolase [Novosphingobium sp.]|nr:MAG: limonene-1,2-epoxide hydrolase [Novosphingobium sp.]